MRSPEVNRGTSSQAGGLTFRSGMSVDLVDYMGSDASVVYAARVSVVGAGAQAYEDADPDEHRGLINYLMSARHGCYDSQTEVLTADGWKFWPDVDGTERFLTLNLGTDEIEYQRADRLVRKRISGPMVRLTMAQVDALVTPDHRMVAAARMSSLSPFGLHPARDFIERSHRLRLGGGEWSGSIHSPEDAALVGFIAADGHVGRSIEFSLVKERKIDWLTERHPVRTNGVRYRLDAPSEQILQWAKQTYTDSGDRCLPRDLLLHGDSETVQALLDGYLAGDGSVSATGKITCSTVSQQMVNDLQEAALKAGLAAVQTATDVKREGAFGTRPLYRLTIYRDLNLMPRIGWTTEARQAQVAVEHYEGEIHCVTVPNGTLYVRRNGKPMWCGNTPFEHAVMTFRVEAPIFVYREWHRHRVWSYNEESGRYKQLDPVFHIPGPERPLVNTGSSARPVLEPGSPDQYNALVARMKEAYGNAYFAYEFSLRDGVAKEVAREVLPVGTYSTMYATSNLRGIMHFLSLRTEAEGSTFPSKPQCEITQAAEQVEAIFAERFPITHGVWVKNGRVAP